MSDPSLLPGTPRGAGYLFAHLLRSLIAVSRSALGERLAHLPSEMAVMLQTLAAQAASTVELVSRISSGLGIPTTTSAGNPASVVLPVQVVDAYGFARAGEQTEGKAFGPGFCEVPWFDVAAQIDVVLLRDLVRASPQFFVSFAVQYVDAEGRRSFASDLGLFRWIEATAPAHGIADLARTFAPRRWHGLITLTSPLAHGADRSPGNIALARQEERVDVFTGRRSTVPFVSGAAIRGQARDLIMMDWLERVGVPPRLARVDLAHALLAGGAIDAGAAVAVSHEVRAAVREACPAWDLFGGYIEGQLMEGQLVVGDAVLVCRETAWCVAEALGWTADEALARCAELPAAAETLVHRAGTRHHHADLAGPSDQMIMHTQAIAAGHRLAWSVALKAGPRATPLQLSTLAHVLRLLFDAGRLGGKSQAGLGGVAYSPMLGDAGDPSLYLMAVDAAAERARAWLLGRSPLVAPTEGSAEKPTEKRRRRGG